MNLLESLPALPDITGRSAYVPTTSNSGDLTVEKVLTGTAGDSDAARNIIPKTAAAILTGGATLGTKMTIQSIVFVVLGLLFLAGGIFSFHEVRQTVVAGVKTAAAAA